MAIPQLPPYNAAIKPLRQDGSTVSFKQWCLIGPYLDPRVHCWKRQDKNMEAFVVDTGRYRPQSSACLIVY
jgi:hypothetical protein